MSEAKSNTVRRLVGDFVFLAYYWTGFQDDSASLLDVCDSRRTANAVLREHKQGRDITLEYAHHANWWVKRQSVRSANTKISQEGH